jgi:hypothetical protein
VWGRGTDSGPDGEENAAKETTPELLSDAADAIGKIPV